MTKTYRAHMTSGLPDLTLRIYELPAITEVTGSPFTTAEAASLPGMYESSSDITLAAGDYLLHWRSAQQNTKAIIEIEA